jgi:hypothetical protein
MFHMEQIRIFTLSDKAHDNLENNIKNKVPISKFGS